MNLSKQSRLLILFVFICEANAISSYLPWNWGRKKINGGWSEWSSWSSCQNKELQTFRFKERTCTNPSPKNGGAKCVGITRKTSPCLRCDSPLGLESRKVTDKQLSASSSHEEFPPQNGRLNGNSAWCMGKKTQEIYFQIDLKVQTAVSAIASQGFYPDPSVLSLRRGRVSKYQIAYSSDGLEWQLYEDINGERKIFLGNEKRNGTVLNKLEPEIMARFVRIYPAGFFGFVCMRVELYGCTFNCGGYLTHSPGNISIASSKAVERDCLWHISLPDDTNKIFLDFVAFDVPCANGMVEVRSGQSVYGAAPILGQYCGIDGTPPHLSDTGKKLWVRFKSNSSDPLVGFLANYRPDCGGYLTTNGTQLKSVNFPGDYFHNLKCGWTVTARTGKSVLMKILSFDVIGDRDRQRCPGDHFAVRDGFANVAPLIGRFCNSRKPPQFICSTGNGMRIRFKSDDAIAGKGFHVVFREIEPNSTCSDPVSSSSTIILPLQTSYVFSSQPLTPSLTLSSASVNSTLNFQLLNSVMASMTSTILQVNQTSLQLMTAMPPLFAQSSIVNTSSGNVSGAGNIHFAQRPDGYPPKEKDDDDALTTIIIISVFSFIVFCMIIASVTPSIIHHMDKRKQLQQKEISNCSMSGVEDGMLDKRACEVIPMLSLQGGSRAAPEQDETSEPPILCGRIPSNDSTKENSPINSIASLETQPNGTQSPSLSERSPAPTPPVDQRSLLGNRSSFEVEAGGSFMSASERDSIGIPSINDNSLLDSQRSSSKLSQDDDFSADEEITAICQSPASSPSRVSQDSWSEVVSCDLEYDTTDLNFTSEDEMDISLGFAAEMQAMLSHFLKTTEGSISEEGYPVSLECDTAGHSPRGDRIGKDESSIAVNNNNMPTEQSHHERTVSPDDKYEAKNTGTPSCLPESTAAHPYESEALGQVLTDLQSTLTVSSDSDSLSGDIKVNPLSANEKTEDKDSIDEHETPLTDCPVWELQPDWQDQIQGGQSDISIQAASLPVDVDVAVPYTLCFNDNKDSGCPSSTSTDNIPSADDYLGSQEPAAKETAV